MHIITPAKSKEEGAYAVMNEFGEKVVFMFVEKDDADRYAMMLQDDEEEEMTVIHVNDRVAIASCEKTGTKYTVISGNDLVVPVSKK